jgi:glycosyltransferase involved in cell wall biosynthesis
LKVTVLVFAYNHEPFIRQALDSVLMQKADFEFEVLIREDCSTDGTREIVLDYAAAHPEKIRLLLSDVNIGSVRIVERALDAARGDYIAMLDGDDYWTSPYKLEKQARFMDAHPEYSLCFHYQELVDAEGEPLPYDNPHTSKLSWSLEEILADCPIGTGSAFLRRSMLPPLPDWFFLCPYGDFPICVLCMQNGPAGYLDDSLGAYRIHGKGFYNGLKSWEQDLLFQYTRRQVYPHLAPKHQKQFAKLIAGQWVGLAMRRRLEGDRLASREIAMEGLADCPHDVRLRLLAHAPLLYVPMRSIWRGWRRMCGEKFQDLD